MDDQPDHWEKYLSQQREKMKIRQRREHEACQKHKRTATASQLRHLRGITTAGRRGYASVDRIQDIVDDPNISGKNVKARIKLNLRNKVVMLDIMRCLITDAMMHHESRSAMIKYNIGKVEMWGKNSRTKKMELFRRIPIMAELRAPRIADRLRVSQVLIWKYLKAMERSGLVKWPPNRKRGNQHSRSLLIIGGYVVHRNRQEEDKTPDVTPVYFWSASQPQIDRRLADFSL